MCQAKSTISGAIHELRLEFYEKYAEDFQMIREYEVMDASEVAVAALEAKATEDASFVKELEDARKETEKHAKLAKAKATTKGK